MQNMQWALLKKKSKKKTSYLSSTEVAPAPVDPAQMARSQADMETLAMEYAGAAQTPVDPAKAQAPAEVSA